jgi:aminopeptidase N
MQPAMNLSSYLLLVPALVWFQLQNPSAPQRNRYDHAPRSVRSRDVDQEHLKLDLKIDLDKEEFTGRAEWALSPFKPVRSVTLDSGDQKIEKVSIGDGAKPETFRDLKFQTRKTELEITLDREYAAGEKFALAIDYKVKEPRKGGHFVVPDETEPNRARGFWTQGEPEDARFLLPCIDSPTDRFTSDVHVTVPKAYQVISNGIMRDNKENEDGTRTCHWVQAQTLVSYLLTVVVGEFDAYEQKWDGLPVLSYVPKGRGADAERSFKKTPAMVEFFSKKIGVRYPWPKYAQTCMEDFSGGMENTSATTLTMDTLHDERAHLDVTSESLVSHELAHQWFGDLLTCKDWGETWLNESFATYFATLWTEHDLGWDEALWARHNEAETYKRTDLRYRRPIISYRYETPSGMFDAHSYPKGARVLHMLRFTLGDELFWKAINEYVKTHQFTTVEAADLRDAIENSTGQGLNWFFDQWLYKGGFPEFDVSWRWDDATKIAHLTVKQVQKVDTITPIFEMPVEIEIATRNSTNVRRMNISKADETFHFPLDERPTRICFDPKDWLLKKLTFEKSKEELLDQLERDQNLMCRVQAIEALGAFAGAKDDDVTAALMKALKADAFWGVRQTAATALGKLSGEKVREALIEAAQRDTKAQVRRESIKSLGGFSHDSTRAALRSIIGQDQSYFAIAEALRALAKVDRNGCRADLIAALKTPSHQEVILRAACDGLVDLKDRSSADEIAKLLDQPVSAQRRAALTGALARLKPDDRAVAERLHKQLDNRRGNVRQATIDALVAMGDPAAIEVLLARRAKNEDPSRILRALDEGIEKLRAKENNLDSLNKELDTLRTQNRQLEERLKKLESAQKKSEDK